MLPETFALALQLPPLAFGAAPPPPALLAPRELTCPIGELGRPWSPPPPRPMPPAPPAIDPQWLHPSGPTSLVNPLADALLLLALSGWVSSTGGTVEFRPPAERNPFLAAPLAPIYTPPELRANPGL